MHCLSFQATFCIVGYGVCVINSSQSFQAIKLKLCTDVIRKHIEDVHVTFSRQENNF